MTVIHLLGDKAAVLTGGGFGLREIAEYPRWQKKDSVDTTSRAAEVAGKEKKNN